MAEQESVPTAQQTQTPTKAPAQAQTNRKGVSVPRVQLKRGVQMMSYDDQSALLAPADPGDGGSGRQVQRQGGEDTDRVHQAAAAGIASGGGALPHAGKIQQAFGSHDVSGIQAHTGSTAQKANKAMGAEAYATGNHVAFGKSPDLHTVAHEAAHVVQQGAGVSLAGGVGKSGDKYENHADKVADAVVAGKSAEPILNEMTGGKGGKGTQKKEKPVQQLASEPVQMDTSGGPPPVNPDPEAEWRTFCNGLDAAAKAAGLGITDTQKRDKFKALVPTERTAYANAAMTPVLRDEFLMEASSRTPVVVMLADMPHFTLYASLATPAERTKFRGLTPDERKDMTVIPQRPYVSQLLTDENKLNTWRSWRVSLALADNRALAGALGVADPTDLNKMANDLLPVCTGKAGERLRRLITDTGFENDGDRTASIQAVITQTKGPPGKDPWQVMQDLRPAWVLKGKPARNDPAFATVPLLKAMSHLSMAKFGTPSAAFLDALITANGQTPDAATRAAFLSKKPDNVAAAFPKWKALGNTFNPAVHVSGVTIAGGQGRIGAYWMYDKGMALVVNPATSGQDIMAKLAVQESPEYQLGFSILELPNAAGHPATQDIRRPTMWDGLWFDQFAAVDDPAQCYGVTSGGSGEVVIEPVALNPGMIKRNVSP